MVKRRTALQQITWECYSRVLIEKQKTGEILCKTIEMRSNFEREKFR